MFGNPDYSPKPVQWGGQQFADPAMLARWLRSRGASPALWALRHPSAAQGLGMPMPQGAPAAPPAQDHPGSMQGPMPPMPGGAMAGAPPAMPPAEHPMGPGPTPNVLEALIAAIAQQSGSGVEPFARVPSEGGMPHPAIAPGHREYLGPEGPGGNANLPVNRGKRLPPARRRKISRPPRKYATDGPPPEWMKHAVPF